MPESAAAREQSPPPTPATPATPPPGCGRSDESTGWRQLRLAGHDVAYAHARAAHRGSVSSFGSPYTDAGATATDSIDGDLTSRIVVVNPVNTALLGTFTITYSVSDLSGQCGDARDAHGHRGNREPAVGGGGGGGGIGIEFALALLLLAIWRARSNRVPRTLLGPLQKRPSRAIIESGKRRRRCGLQRGEK